MGRFETSLGSLDELARLAQYDNRKLAQLCRLSRRQMQRAFRRRFDRSPQQWLNERRIAAAFELLATGLSVKETAFKLGFKQRSHFSRTFKLFTHVNASEFFTVTFTNERTD
jgi:AraC-like DNA-binding protein